MGLVPKPGMHRLTIDFPDEMWERLKQAKKENEDIATICQYVRLAIDEKWYREHRPE